MTVKHDFLPPHVQLKFCFFSLPQKGFLFFKTKDLGESQDLFFFQKTVLSSDKLNGDLGKLPVAYEIPKAA